MYHKLELWTVFLRDSLPVTAVTLTFTSGTSRSSESHKLLLVCPVTLSDCYCKN